MFAAGEYDFIFDVDLNDKLLKLPFNKEDDPQETAEKFLTREGMTKNNLQAIIDFLCASTGLQRKIAVTKSKESNLVVPYKELILFEEKLEEDLIGKIAENTNLSCDEMEVLKRIISKLEGSSDTVVEFLEEEIDYVINNLMLLSEHQGNCLELFRVLTLRERNPDKLGANYLNWLVDCFDRDDENMKTAVLRNFCNWFKNANKNILLYVDKILKLLSTALKSDYWEVKMTVVKLMFK